MALISRREMLRLAGGGLAGVAAAAAGERPSSAGGAGKIPISLIVDDGGPVDPMFYMHPGYETPWIVPIAFTERVAATFERFDMRGKFTMLPMPSCLGRIDKSLERVPQQHLEGFLKIVRERIAPRFDITPEFLTHLSAYDLETGRYQHVFEDAWISRAPLDEVIEYFVLAFQILQNVGLPAQGITSPWESGIDVEKKYAQALAEAHWRVYARKLSWYFLHVTEWDQPRRCGVEYRAQGREQVVVSVPANTADIFWCMDLATQGEKLEFIRRNIDRLVPADGGPGRIQQLIEGQYPVVLLTHWQSLYHRGTGLGLEGLTALAERIHQVFGNSVRWVPLTEIAGTALLSPAAAS
jgi:hypothetical protein